MSVGQAVQWAGRTGHHLPGGARGGDRSTDGGLDSVGFRRLLQMQAQRVRSSPRRDPGLRSRETVHLCHIHPGRAWNDTRVDTGSFRVSWKTSQWWGRESAPGRGKAQADRDWHPHEQGDCWAGGGTLRGLQSLRSGQQGEPELLIWRGALGSGRVQLEPEPTGRGYRVKAWQCQGSEGLQQHL